MGVIAHNSVGGPGTGAESRRKLTSGLSASCGADVDGQSGLLGLVGWSNGQNWVNELFLASFDGC